VCPSGVPLWLRALNDYPPLLKSIVRRPGLNIAATDATARGAWFYALTSLSLDCPSLLVLKALHKRLPVDTVNAQCAGLFAQLSSTTSRPWAVQLLSEAISLAPSSPGLLAGLTIDIANGWVTQDKAGLIKHVYAFLPVALVRDIYPEVLAANVTPQVLGYILWASCFAQAEHDLKFFNNFNQLLGYPAEFPSQDMAASIDFLRRNRHPAYPASIRELEALRSACTQHALSVSMPTVTAIGSRPRL
jgi:hypothetical protein